MKKQILKRIACFTIAALVFTVCTAGNAVQAAAEQQVQMVNEEDSKSSKESEAANDSSGEKKQQDGKETDKTNIIESDGIQREGENLQETESQQEPDHLQEAKNPQNQENSQEMVNQQEPENTQQPENSQEPGNSQEPENLQEPGNSQEAENPSENPKEQDTSGNPQGTQQGDKTDHSQESGKPDKSEEVRLKKPVLKAASKPNGEIKLSWSRIDGAAEYVLLCSTKKDSGFHRIYATKKGNISYKDEGRVSGKIYYYQLVAFSKGRTSRADSKIVCGRSLEQAKLTEISNVSGSKKLVLQWDPVKGADSYEILRKNISTGEYQTVGSVKGSKTSYTDVDRRGGTIYTYKIYAKDAAGGRGSYSKSMSQMAIDQNRKMIALTYDDGPSAHTPVVLDALAKYSGHATFFVVGSSVDRYADSLRRAVALGCEIGNHTYNHSNLKNLSAGQIQSVLNMTNQAVKKQAGVEIHLLRPPYGSYNTATFAAAGMPVIMWSIDTLDWKTKSTSATIQCVQQKAYDGAIVLMHDLHQPTVMAADAIMKYLTDAGYQLVTVSELAAYRGGLEKNAAYSQFRK